MFNDLSRIFVTLWFRHHHDVINGGEPYEKNGNWVCNKHGCPREFVATGGGTAKTGYRGSSRAKENMRRHRLDKKYEGYHNYLLYVYLPHHFVFKTNIVISVNAIMKSAKEKMLFRM
jgi:hypothetical protein